LQLFLAENRLECRSGPFQTQVTTPIGITPKGGVYTPLFVRDFGF